MTKTVTGDGLMGYRRGAWSAVLLAALPHLLLAPVFAISALSLGNRLFGLWGIVLCVGLAGTLQLAWRRRWPLWSGSWAAYWLLVPYFVMSSTLPLPDILALLPAVVVGLLIFQRRPLHGLLALPPALLFFSRLWVFEHLLGGDWVWFGLWLLMALVAGAIVRRGSLRAGVVLIIGLHLVAGLIFTLGRAFLPFYSPFSNLDMAPRRTPALRDLANDFVPLTLAAITMSLALVLLHRLWRLGRQDERRARWAYALLLGGMLTALVGVLSLRTRLLPASDVAPIALLVGLLLSLGAALALTRTVLARGGDRRRALLVPLLATFAPLVVLPQAMPFAPAGVYSDSLQIQIMLSYAGTLLWSVGALWVLAGDGHDHGVRGYLPRRRGFQTSQRTFQTPLHS